MMEEREEQDFHYVNTECVEVFIDAAVLRIYLHSKYRQQLEQMKQLASYDEGIVGIIYCRFLQQGGIYLGYGFTFREISEKRSFEGFYMDETIKNRRFVKERGFYSSIVLREPGADVWNFFAESKAIDFESFFVLSNFEQVQFLKLKAAVAYLH